MTNNLPQKFQLDFWEPFFAASWSPQAISWLTRHFFFVGRGFNHPSTKMGLNSTPHDDLSTSNVEPVGYTLPCPFVGCRLFVELCLDLAVFQRASSEHRIETQTLGGLRFLFRSLYFLQHSRKRLCWHS